MTSLLSDQSILDLLLERDKEEQQQQQYSSSSTSYLTSDEFNFDVGNFNVDDSLAEFESLFGGDNDILNMFIDPKRPLPLPLEQRQQEDMEMEMEDETESDAASSPRRVPDRLTTDSSGDNLKFNSSSSSSGYSDSSSPPAADDYFSPQTPAEFLTEEVVEDTTIDMGICADVEVLTTDAISVDGSEEYSEVDVVAEFIPSEVKLELSSECALPQLSLTEEEKKLLGKEGISLPEHLPLTKAEERNLKRIRRKIRNKESAQNSRKRKKEYVDGLESRVKMCTTQNVELKKKITHLQGQNQSLVAQVRKLQALISSANAANVANKPAQASACALVLLLSFGLFLLPSLQSGMDNETKQFPRGPASPSPSSAVKSPFAGNSRSLLNYTPNPPPGLGLDNNKYGVVDDAKDVNWLPENDDDAAATEDPPAKRFAGAAATKDAAAAALRTEFKLEEPPPPVIEKESGGDDHHHHHQRASNLSNVQSRTIVVNSPTRRNVY